MKSILVTGATGVLGKNFIRKHSHTHNIIEAKREPKNKSDIEINSWSMETPKIQIDLVIHFAGKYLVDESIESTKNVFDSVIGTATVVADYCGRTGTPLIALGSYFEKAPSELQPWSYYASAKKSAHDLLVLAANQHNFPLRYIYCYDTYGDDIGRRKIVDVLLDPMTKYLELSEGHQKMNLTHVNDFVSGISKIIEELEADPQGTKAFQIKNSRDEFTLRDIVMKVNNLRDHQIELVFGAKPYRKNEVFSIWDCAPSIPNWQPEIIFDSYLKTFLGSKNE